MDDPIIEFRNVTMSFRVSRRHYGFKATLLHPFQLLRDKAHTAEFRALDDVSFSIRKGEHVGIVGPNGCGKTTTLSLIGGVYKRYRGQIDVRGRVAMMLALGAGFNSQLSGRDNIILNGVLQGMTRKEMLSLVQNVIDFADIGDFIDAPLYQYSSGMLARVGFGIATAIRPDILLVDEVMAVGDADFKKRCESRIRSLLDGGTTLVLVSHNPGDIQKYCRRVIRLDHGKIVGDSVSADGNPESADREQSLKQHKQGI